MRYLAIGFWTEPGSGESFTLSRETDSDDVEEVLEMLCNEAHEEPENTATILLLESAITSTEAPKVVEHWGAANGDFEFLLDMSEDDGDEDDGG